MISINSFLIIYLAVFAASVILNLTIEGINTKYLKTHGDKVPQPFNGIIDKEELKEINQYTIDNNRFSIIETCTGKIVFLFIILSGILPCLAGALSGISFIPAGLLFFAVPVILSALASLPFGYYHSFIIEEKYGFNTQTVKIWITDLVKSLLLTCMLGGILLSSLLIIVSYTGRFWWLWIWGFFLLFQLLMTILYPTVIAPLFNKFTPLEDLDLAAKIEEMAEKEGLNISGIFQMDASKRSKHTNAYFSGLGKTKRIVLYDSLIQSHDLEEILAVLAHEIGHFKKHHIKKQLIITSLSSLVFFFLLSKMIAWEGLFHGFGFSVMPAYAGLFLAGVFLEPAGFFFAPVGMAVSRKFEREADLYCVRIIKNRKPFIRALKKMAKENLANLNPHPLYVLFHYSHPPLLERIKLLEN